VARQIHRRRVVRLAIEDLRWGMHEFTLTDPSGNRIRIGRKVSP
jgi:hypothetical protein